MPAIRTASEPRLLQAIQMRGNVRHRNPVFETAKIWPPHEFSNGSYLRHQLSQR